MMRRQTAAGDAFIRRRAPIRPVILLSALTLAGCLGPRQTAPAIDPASVSDDSFPHYLAQAPVVTVDEAYRAMLILADGSDAAKSFDAREAALTQRGIVNPAWKLEAGNIIDRGSVAAMVCKICDMHGGVNRIVFGSIGLGDRRYAARELVYRQIMSEGPDFAAMTGGELVSILSKADDYMQRHKLYESKEIELGTEQELEQGTPPPPSTQP